MLTKEKMLHLFGLLNDKLKKNGQRGEVYIVGGASMCLVLNARASTYDIDALFEPKTEINKYIKEIAAEEGIKEDWLNDGVKGFINENLQTKLYLELSNLIIYSATPEYIFAMKAKAARTDEESFDAEDLKFLIEYLRIECLREAEEILTKYYSVEEILPKTTYFIESIINEKED